MEALRFQELEVAVHICQRIFRSDLNERRFSQFCVAHLRKNLADHGGSSRPAQAVENEYLVLRLAVDKIIQLPEALTLAISADRCRKGPQRLADADVGSERGGVHGFRFGKLLLQCLQLLLQFLPPFDLCVKIL